MIQQNVIKELLSKDIARRINLLETLLVIDDYISLQRLSELLQCSPRVVISDIKLLNEKYSVIKITNYRHLGYKINYKSTDVMDTVYKQIIQESPELQILKLTFMEEINSVRELADELFISVSTVHRLIRKINEVLAPWQVHISKNPLKLIGNEVHIRRLTTSLFFIYAYLPKKENPVPLKAGLSELAVKLMESFLAANQIQLSYAIYTWFVEGIKVALHRMVHHHTLAPQKSQLTFLELPNIFYQEHFQAEFKKVLGCELTETVCEELFSSFYTGKYIARAADIPFVLKEKPESQQIFEKIHTVVQEFCHSFNINAENRAAMQELYVELYNFYQFSFAPTIIVKLYLTLFDLRIYLKYPDFYAEALREIKKLFTENSMGVQNGFENVFLFLVMITIPELIEEWKKHRKSLNVFIVKDVFLKQTSFIVNQISLHYAEKMTFSEFTLTAYNQKFLKEQVKKYALVLSALPLDRMIEDVKNFVCIEYFLTARDYQQISYMIQQQ